MTCATCLHAIRESQDHKITLWLEQRGLAFCRAYSNSLKRKFLTTLVNAAGPLCGGRWFESDGRLI